jgi:hypothetical protein
MSLLRLLLTLETFVFLFFMQHKNKNGELIDAVRIRILLI